jgi:hypothetical protein
LQLYAIQAKKLSQRKSPIKCLKVVKLVSEEMPAGYQSVIWNTKNTFGQSVSAGIYFYQIQTNDFVKTRKMVLLK